MAISGINLNLFRLDTHLHRQVLIMCFLVATMIVFLQFLLKSSFRSSPGDIFFQFIYDIVETQEARTDWIAFLGSIFLFIFVSNWLGAILPWESIRELLKESTGIGIPFRAPTNDINTTVALALMRSVAYLYARISKLGLKGYFTKYFEPLPFLFPLKLLEDFTKPLSLSFRLFRNILADELVVAVLLALAPFFVPIPLILLGLFTSAIQALIFTTLVAAYIGEAKHAE